LTSKTRLPTLIYQYVVVCIDEIDRSKGQKVGAKKMNTNDFKLDVSNELYKFIGDTYNTCINLRKVKNINIEQNGVLFSPRPQHHVMLIAPFGSFKSTLIKRLNEVTNGDVMTIDDVTKPSLLGTITNKGEYIQGMITKVGGKILAIDEWDSLRSEATECLLSPLENQRINRQMAFTVKDDIIVKNEFTDITVNGGRIDGRIQFTCIAMSMGFSMRKNVQYALGSRFRMIRLKVSESDMKKIIKGIGKFDFVDKNQTVENILVKQNAWSEYTDSVHNTLEEKLLYPPYDMLGYVNRSIHDGLRDAIGGLIIESPQKEYIINDSSELIKFNDNVIKQIAMYTIDLPTSTKFKEMIKRYPDKDYKFYCTELNISPKHYYRLRDEYESEKVMEENK